MNYLIFFLAFKKFLPSYHNRRYRVYPTVSVADPDKKE
jgi:hypothetical protein